MFCRRTDPVDEIEHTVPREVRRRVVVGQVRVCEAMARAGPPQRQSRSASIGGGRKPEAFCNTLFGRNAVTRRHTGLFAFRSHPAVTTPPTEPSAFCSRYSTSTREKFRLT